MDWKNLVGDVVSQLGNKGVGQQESGGAEGNMFGSGIGAMLLSMGTQEVMAHILNASSSMNPEQRGGMVGSLLSSLSSSGVDVRSLLDQLGINPAVLDNLHSASAEDIAKLAAHAHENAPEALQSALDTDSVSENESAAATTAEEDSQGETDQANDPQEDADVNADDDTDGDHE